MRSLLNSRLLLPIAIALCVLGILIAATRPPDLIQLTPEDMGMSGMVFSTNTPEPTPDPAPTVMPVRYDTPEEAARGKMWHYLGLAIGGPPGSPQVLGSVDPVAAQDRNRVTLGKPYRIYSIDPNRFVQASGATELGPLLVENQVYIFPLLLDAVPFAELLVGYRDSFWEAGEIRGLQSASILTYLAGVIGVDPTANLRTVEPVDNCAPPLPSGAGAGG